MKIRDVLSAKGSEVVTVEPDMTVHDAMRLLVRHNIGALVVVNGEDLCGIITERDMLRAGAADLQKLARLRVVDLMTMLVVTTEPDAEIRSVMDTMTNQRIRHLPVIENGELCGMISIGDIINALRRNSETEVEQLQAYITGRA
jgi:CBS domain-containing protein